MLYEAVKEIVAVASARGVNITADAINSNMALVDGLSPTATASMQRDIIEGRPSELSEQAEGEVRSETG